MDITQRHASPHSEHYHLIFDQLGYFPSVTVSKQIFARDHSYANAFISTFIFVQIKLIFIRKSFSRGHVLKQRQKAIRT